MTVHGHVENGVVVIDGPAQLPEGAAVRVEIVVPTVGEDETVPTLYERLKPIIGAAEGLPADAATNVDHYLYGEAMTTTFADSSFYIA